jgi:hypothetical protein
MSFIINPYVYKACVPVIGANTQYGTGTSIKYEYPYYPLYNFSQSASIYLQTDLGSSKQFTGCQIFQAGFSVPFTQNNNEIWMAHVAQSSFDTDPAVNFSDMTITNLTKVKNSFNHTVTTNGIWYDFNFDFNFCYNGINNLLFIWKSYDGSGTSSGYGYTRSTTASFRGMQAFGSTYPTGNGTRSSSIISLKLKY